MKVVVQADVHGVQVISLQHFPEIAVPMGYSVLLGYRVQLALVDVRGRDDLGLGDVPVEIEVHLRDLPHTDHADPDLFHPFSCSMVAAC